MPRMMEITTPLGADVLLFHRMRAREELSRVSEFHIDLLSDKGSINVDDILGKNVTVAVESPDGSARHFNGFVTRFAQGGSYGRYFMYHAEVRPWLWFLSRTADCRIFQEMTVPDIVKEVFEDHDTAEFVTELTGSYRTRTYCVQYRETDLSFVSRLLEEEGIYYYFRHTDEHNTLVLTDSSSKHERARGCGKLPFIASEQLTRADIDHVSSWGFSREIQPGVYVHDDYDLDRPSVELKTRKTLQRSYSPSDYEIYDYPGHYLQKTDGEQYASVRIDEYGTQFETVEAVTNARGLAVGCMLEVNRLPRSDQNREYLVLAAKYDLKYGEYEAMPAPSGASYTCTFTAISSKQQFRPRRLTPKPFMQGPQTAVVVGPSGDEIYTDKHGRVKVLFHWDRRGEEKKDENCSCWIRVSQPWAGKGWGSVSTPRIGQEVIIDFLEGDPDQPIVIGRVYNADNQPPFGFPAGAVTSGQKSATHKGSGFNEMSMDDTAGKEKVTIHAQYDMNTTVKHDQTTAVQNNRSTSVTVDDTLNVDAKRTMHVKAKLTETVDGGQEVTVASGFKETITGGATSTISGGLTSTVNDGQTSTVNGKWDNTINGHLKETVSSGAEQSVTGESKTTVDGPMKQSASGTLDIHAGGAGTYSSDDSLKFTVGGSSVEIGQAAITITASGSTIKVDAAGVSLNGKKISLNG